MNRAELSLTVPIVNTLAFLFTVLGDWWVDKKVISRGQLYYPMPPPPHAYSLAVEGLLTRGEREDTWMGMVLSLCGKCRVSLSKLQRCYYLIACLPALSPPSCMCPFSMRAYIRFRCTSRLSLPTTMVYCDDSSIYSC